MGRLSPRGHTEDSRETLIALTSRTSVQAVKESGLIEREGFASIGCSGSCADGAECDCSHSWRAPRQPRKPEQHPWWTPNGAIAAAVVAVVGFCAWVGYWLLPALAR